MKKLFSIFFFILYAVIFCSAQEIINPSEGAWANKQVLVLDLPASASAYYSLTGDAPEVSGLAYDGPVLLDVTGDVKLNVAVIFDSGEVKNYAVKYTVKEVDISSDKEKSDFLLPILSTGVVKYTPGEDFIIPGIFDYSIGVDSKSFDAGKRLFLEKETLPQRYVPCSVRSKENVWRFIIHIEPFASGVYSRLEVPFLIKDWNKILFTDSKYIYKIDDEWWKSGKEPVILDRTKPHMISWQRIDYNPENPVNTFKLPPKLEPDIRTETSGAVKISANTGGFKFAFIKNDVHELFDSIKIDTFDGDKFSGTATIGIYYESVYQGELSFNFNVNKRLPSRPQIISSVNSSFSRKDVDIIIKAEDSVYASISGPLKLKDGYSKDNAGAIFDLNASDFIKTDKRKFSLKSNYDGAEAYKILAYAQDKNGNRSKNSEYTVIIDKCNFYIDGENTNEEQDGSKENPFSSFDKILPMFKESRFLRLYVSNKVNMPAGETFISSNCKIEGNDAELIFPPDSNLIIRSSSFSVENAIISLKERPVKKDYTNLFTVERGVLDFSNVELSAVCGKSGTIINSDNSVINIKNSGLTALADTYVCIVSSVSSRITVKNSRISSSAGTCVNFSAQGGLFDLLNSECSVTGIHGRVAELFDTHGSVFSCRFSANLTKSKGGKAVHIESKSNMMELKDNLSDWF